VKRMRCAARWRRRSRTPVTDGYTILDVPGWSEALLPPRISGVSVADENVVLTDPGRPNGASGTPDHTSGNRWTSSARAIRVSSGSDVRAQMLKTSIMVNFLGYIADVDPGPTLAVEPRSEDAKRFPRIASRRCSGTRRHSRETRRGEVARFEQHAMHKVFANGSGHITFTGAISPSGLAMRPIRYLLLDEIDRYPTSAGSEGDPVSLAMQRTGEFEHNKK